MKQGLTEIVFILDKSGSMGGLEKDTIDGYNAFLEKQRKIEGEAFVSTVLFSDRDEVLHDRVPLSEIKNLTEEDYSVGGLHGTFGCHWWCCSSHRECSQICARRRQT